MTNPKDAEDFENYLCGGVDGERNYTTINPMTKKVLPLHGSLNNLGSQLAAAMTMAQVFLPRSIHYLGPNVERQK